MPHLIARDPPFNPKETSETQLSGDPWSAFIGEILVGPRRSTPRTTVPEPRTRLKVNLKLISSSTLEFGRDRPK